MVQRGRVRDRAQTALGIEASERGAQRLPVRVGHAGTPK
jgi:hypothetical protein